MAREAPVTGRYLQISLSELEVFLEVVRTKSIRETARRYHLEAGQVSRLIKRLEIKIGSRLMERSPSGIALTQQGAKAVVTATSIIRSADELAALARENRQSQKRVFGIGAASYLCARLLGPVASAYLTPEFGFKLRLLDVSPDQLIAHALKGAYDLAVHVGNLDWPRSWQTSEIGVMKWQLFANSKMNVPSRCTVANIKTHPFILPIYWSSEGLVDGNDQCPLPGSQRISGVATSTAETALAVLTTSKHLAFLPEILARDALMRNEIRVVHVREWKPVVKPVILAVRSATVPQRLFSDLTVRLRKALNA